MYIPLFAATSHYNDCYPEAPNIISLDEAFAGIDDENIRDNGQNLVYKGAGTIHRFRAPKRPTSTLPPTCYYRTFLQNLI
ncbi:SbcC/MukB-like Walker B domain-containing protein [Desulfoscipio gibsoniae]|uniref:SbcC/MukB-like Walker B domain-containing protein n=1 Tax=Desulfoscipio gibsoniae TaxID=102134 RepID=UPI00338E2B64